MRILRGKPQRNRGKTSMAGSRSRGNMCGRAASPLGAFMRTEDFGSRWHQSQLNTVDDEIAKLAFICDIKMLDPGVIERVIAGDATVCGKNNRKRFIKCAPRRHALHAHGRQHSGSGSGGIREDPGSDPRALAQAVRPRRRTLKTRSRPLSLRGEGQGEGLASVQRKKAMARFARCGNPSARRARLSQRWWNLLTAISRLNTMRSRPRISPSGER